MTEGRQKDIPTAGISKQFSCLRRSLKDRKETVKACGGITWWYFPLAFLHFQISETSPTAWAWRAWYSLLFLVQVLYNTRAMERMRTLRIRRPNHTISNFVWVEANDAAIRNRRCGVVRFEQWGRLSRNDQGSFVQICHVVALFVSFHQNVFLRHFLE